MIHRIILSLIVHSQKYKIMPKYLYPLIILFFAFSGLEAQNKAWTLQECIEYAMKNNIQIKQTALNIEYDENVLKQSKLSRYPSLNARTGSNYSFGRALDLTTYEFTDNEQILSANASASSSMTLFNGFRQRNTIEQNEINLMASYKDVEKVKNDIGLNIAAAYLQILFNKELHSVARNQLEITGQQLDRTQKMVDAGKLARGSALELIAQYAAEEVNVVTAENQLQLSYLNLQQILDLPYDPEFSVEIPDLPVPGDSLLMMSAHRVYEVAAIRMPQIKSAELRVESSEIGLDIARAGRYPSLNLSGDYSTGFSDNNRKIEGNDPVTGLPQYGKYPFWEQMNDNQSIGLGVSLSIPIFNGGQVSASISNAQIQLENSKLELQNARNTLFKTIQQSYNDALAALKKYKATLKALASMEESFMYTEKKFEVGLVNTVDYNMAKNQLTNTQSDLLQAKYDFIFKTEILNFYRGEPITL